MGNLMKRFKEVRASEDGLTLAEVLVAIMVAMVVLTATAVTLSEGFKSFTAAETKSTAVSIGEEHMDEIKAKNWLQTRLIKTVDTNIPATYNEEAMFIKTVEDETWSPALEEQGVRFEETEIVNGNAYNVKTYITKASEGTFDSSGNHIRFDRMTINGVDTVEPIYKNVTIIVTWNNGTEVLSTPTVWSSAPGPQECIPPHLFADGSAGNDKWDAQERIQACEGRK